MSLGYLLLKILYSTETMLAASLVQKHGHDRFQATEIKEICFQDLVRIKNINAFTDIFIYNIFRFFCLFLFHVSQFCNTGDLQHLFYFNGTSYSYLLPKFLALEKIKNNVQL